MLDNPRRDQRLSDFRIDSQPHVEFSRAFRPANLRKLIAFDVCHREPVSARSMNKRRILPVILRANFVCGALEESKIKTMQTKRRPCKTHRDRVPVVASIVEGWLKLNRDVGRSSHSSAQIWSNHCWRRMQPPHSSSQNGRIPHMVPSATSGRRLPRA